MAITTTNITGVIALPNGTIPSKSSVTFTMTGFDTDATAGVTIAPRSVTSVLSDTGALDVDLWSNEDGERTTFYDVRLNIYNGTNPLVFDAGKIEVPTTGGPYDLNDLLPIAPPSGATVDEYIAQLAASVAAAEAAETNALASAAEAALYDGVWLDDVSDLIADTALTYTASQPGTVVAGDIVQTRAEGFSYEVAASGATDEHLETAGGVKLYAVPDATGRIFATQLDMTPNASGDSVAGSDNREKSQRAIDYLNSIGGGIFSPDRGTYYLTNTPYPGSSGAGGCGIVVKDNVSIIASNTAGGDGFGWCDGIPTTGFYGRVITSLGDSGGEDGLSNSVISCFIDGNRATRVGDANNVNNILIEAKDNVSVSSCWSIGAEGSGIIIRGSTTSDLNQAATISANNNVVRDCKTIGIQASQFSDLTVYGNRVYDCEDNGIDIYGERGSGVESSGGFSISGNHVENCLNGIFPETVQNGTVTGNTIVDCKHGIHINRINSKCKNIVVSGNSIRETSATTYTDTGGVYITGPMEGVTANANTVDGVDAAIKIGAGGSNIQYINVSNTLVIDCTDWLVLNALGTISYVKVSGTLAKGITNNEATLTSGTLADNTNVEPVRVMTDAVGPFDVFDSGAGSTANSVIMSGRLRNGAGTLSEFVRQEFISQVYSGLNQDGRWKLSVLSDSSLVDMIDVNAESIGFFGSTPAAQPSITGSTDTGKVTSLIAALVSLGLVTDSTT